MRKLIFILFGILVIHPFYSQKSKVYTAMDIEEFPTFNGGSCAEIGSEACFTKQLNMHVSQYFSYPMDALRKDLEGKVFIQFIIDSLGHVGDIRTRSLHETFEKEGRRIIEKIPPLNAAKIGGKPVSMVHNFQIKFNYIAPGEPANLPQTVDLEITDANTADLVPFEEVFSPPVLNSCNGKEDLSDCFKQSLEASIRNYVQSKGYTSKTEALAKLYFEINTDRSISNITVISGQANLRTYIDLYLKTLLVVSKEARDKVDESISCFYTTEMYFERTK